MQRVAIEGSSLVLPSIWHLVYGYVTKLLRGLVRAGSDGEILQAHSHGVLYNMENCKENCKEKCYGLLKNTYLKTYSRIRVTACKTKVRRFSYPDDEVQNR